MLYCVFFLLIVVYVTRSRWKIKHRRKGPSNARNPSNAQLFKETVIVLFAFNKENIVIIIGLSIICQRFVLDRASIPENLCPPACDS